MRINSVRDMAAAVRGRRQDLAISQTELALRAGVSRQWVSEFETGKSTAEFGLVMGVIETLGLSVDLLNRNEDADSPGHGPVDLDALLNEYRDR